MEDTKQVVIKHHDRHFDIIYKGEIVASIYKDESPVSAAYRVLAAMGYGLTDKS